MHEAVSMSAGCVQHIRGDSKHLSVLSLSTYIYVYS